jgi:Recombination endonuclease VII
MPCPVCDREQCPTRRHRRYKSRVEFQKDTFDRHLRQKYGLTRDAYDAMVRGQQNRCVLCNKTVSLVVDHDHVSGKVRGLLCDRCNVGLGCFEDDIDRLERACRYLKENRE